ncbi:MAG: hypothetical protein Q7S87_10180 [Agitococcus sp.]|nr:hypothetical protein [Agitococcus sp.]
MKPTQLKITASPADNLQFEGSAILAFNWESGGGLSGKATAYHTVTGKIVVVVESQGAVGRAVYAVVSRAALVEAAHRGWLLQKLCGTVHATLLKKLAPLFPQYRCEGPRHMTALLLDYFGLGPSVIHTC